MNVRKWKLTYFGGVTVSALLGAVMALTSCGGGDDLECGPGTSEVDGACVPGSTLTCATGTTEVNGECVPDTTLTCGTGTVDDNGACVPVARTILASDWIPPSSDWPASPTHTVQMVENAVDDLVFTASPALNFVQGEPYVVRITNAAGNANKHYFTARDFFRAVAWRKVQTRHAEYKAPYFDAVELLVGGQLDLYFVPVVPGNYAVECTIGGHSEAGMHSTMTITGDSDVTLDQEIDPNWDPELGVDWRRGSDCGSIWKDTVANGCGALHTDVGPITNVELGNDVYEFGGVTFPLALTAGVAYKITLENASTNQAKHYFTAPELYRTSVWRKAQDGDAEIKAPYLRAVELVMSPSDSDPPRFTELYIVPTVPASYEVYCTQTGHREGGMDEIITVN